jgi:hypothetical protein
MLVDLSTQVGCFDFLGSGRGATELGAQVLPGGVQGFDEVDFFFAAPGFPLFFAGDGGAGGVEGLEVDEFDGAVAGGEAGGALRLVLGDAAFEVVGHAGVEDAGGAGHDVGVVDHFLAS